MRKSCDVRGEWIELNFPAKPERSVPEPEGLGKALGLTPKYVGRNDSDFLVEAESERIVRGLHPDFGALKGLGVRGVMVTSRTDSTDFDFVSRFFAPGVGVDEDPVTGSAHCCLGPFWAKRLNKTTLSAYQASTRGGALRVRVEGDRVVLAGKAVTVMCGELV